MRLFGVPIRRTGPLSNSLTILAHVAEFAQWSHPTDADRWHSADDVVAVPCAVPALRTALASVPRYSRKRRLLPSAASQSCGRRDGRVFAALPRIRNLRSAGGKLRGSRAPPLRRLSPARTRRAHRFSCVRRAPLCRFLPPCSSRLLRGQSTTFFFSPRSPLFCPLVIPFVAFPATIRSFGLFGAWWSSVPSLVRGACVRRSFAAGRATQEGEGWLVGCAGVDYPPQAIGDESSHRF